MIGELYNWKQLRAYSIVALKNVLDNTKDVNVGNFVKELDTLQTLYGKEGIVKLSEKYFK